MNIRGSGFRIIVQLSIGLWLLGLSGLALAGQLDGDTQPRLTGTALVKELQKGGHVVYFRHGATSDFGVKKCIHRFLLRWGDGP